jgi:predicted MFS family arabinose efflux permease
VHDLVGPEVLPSAVGMNSVLVNLGRILGPAAASILIATVGLAACFLVNAASFLAVIVSLSLMRSHELHQEEPVEGDDPSVRAGLAYARRTPGVLAPVLMMLLIGIFTFEFSVSLPLMAKFAFHGGAGSLGWLMSAMGVGAMVGGLITAGRRFDGIGNLAWAAVAFGGATALVAFAPTLVVAAVLMVVVGVFSARFVALSNTVLQLGSEPGMRSRVLAMWSVAFLGSSLVGGPLVGYLGETFGAPASLGVAAVGGVLAGLVGWWGYTRTREERVALAEEPARAAA